eukprot:gene10031-32060_t
MERPPNVGIHAMEFYVPSTYVAQEDLETYDGIAAGKYTIGLGQENMAVCGEREDINSACLTAVQNLLEKYDIPHDAVGRLEVGTETMVDKSKAVKTTLMRLFNENGQYDIEGIDSKNACYGGTAAVLNSLAWVESSAWDGRYAVVVAGDIAVYEPGPARPTGGAGIFAMLIGPNAPLVVEAGVRGTHMEDFKMAFGEDFKLGSADYSIFHAPYNKLVQKSFGRYLWNDYLRDPASVDAELAAGFEEYKNITANDSYTDRAFLKHLVNISKSKYQEMVQPTELITKQCGNSYCGSTYAGLLSLITNKQEALKDTRTTLFSYGSGLAATQFSIKVNGQEGADGVQHIAKTTDVKARLAARTKVTPEAFTETLAHREATYTNFDYEPTESTASLAKGTYYLTKIDELERRHYARAYHTSAATAAAVPAAAATYARSASTSLFANPRVTSLLAPTWKVARRALLR